PGLSTPTDRDYPIALAQGWNQISDPFDFPVAWSSIGKPAGVGMPVRFDPSLRTIGDYADAPADVLEPFEGYFVKADEAATILVPPRAANMASGNGPGAPAGSSAHTAAEDLWRARFAARTDNACDGSNAFGIRSGAEAGFDPFDSPKPPPTPGGWVRAAFAHPEWGNG